MPNYRNDRISEEMKKEIDSIVRDKLDDPRITGTFSITRVDVSRDLSHAKVYVSVLEDENREGLLKALKSAAGFVRHELMHSMIIRHTPQLQFVQDDNIAYGIHIDRLLKQVAPNPPEGEAAQTDDATS